ncbi:MAG: NAD-dependent epimerase/dehydratase family protein, partial [Siphonobacter aquaeclarae]|nr:NAD-dependent epimerase/dehydratase family protein [Siphonobacter aquaeclarae]
MNRILITGGAGFIGSRLSIRLINKGYTVTVLDNLSEQIHGEDPETTSELFQSIRDKVTFINGSVVDKDCLRNAIEGQDAIVHLAAETGTGQSMYAIDKYVEVNIGGTAKLLDILTNQEHQVKKVVVASSRAIYGEGKYVDSDGKVYYPSQRNQEDMDTGYFELKAGENALFPVATDEESRIHPSSLYGISKYNQEQMIMTLCPAIGVHPVALRYQNVYGPGQSLRNPYTGILSIFSTKIRNGNDIVIFEDGKESRDFVYIDDIVSATVSALEMDEANGQVYNVGTGVPTDVITV